MRIPTSAFPNTLVAQLQQLTTRQATLQNQVATGQRITNPSDDPAATARVLQLQSEMRQVRQFDANNNRALALSQASSTSVRQLKTISDRAGELAVLGNGATSPDAYTAYGYESNQLLEQALQAANTQFAGEHLFGGTKSDSAPFTATRDASGKITAVTYTGAASAAQFTTSEGSRISPTTDGTENQQFADFMNHLVSLRDALKTGNQAGVQAVQPNLNTSETHILNTVSDLGAKQTRLEADTSQNQARFAELSKLSGAQTDVDLPSTVVKLTQSQSAYQAALQSGAKILNLSILDYLR